MHVIYGCYISMYEELKLLPLVWWTSDYKFRDYLQTVKDSTITPAIRIMYDNLIKEHGVWWLYTSIFLANIIAGVNDNFLNLQQSP